MGEGDEISRLLSDADVALNEEFPPNIDAAFSAYQRALELDENNVDALDALGELLANLGDHMTPDEVEEILKEIPVDSRGNFDYVMFARKLAEGPKGCPTLISREN